jgi:hypothetical protein
MPQVCHSYGVFPVRTFKFRQHGLLQCDGNAGDGVIVRTALQRGEDGRVDSVVKVEKLFSLLPNQWCNKLEATDIFFTLAEY